MVRSFIVALLLVSIAACVSGRRIEPVASRDGVAVAAQPRAAEAGAEILRLGGNAVDAAIAMGFAIAVVEPTMNSIGGRSLALTRTPDGRFRAFDGMTEIPAAFVPPVLAANDGYGVIATPGTVATLAALHEAYGSLPWGELLVPAIRLAEDGFVVLPGEAARQARYLDAVASNPGFRANLLAPDGTSYAAGRRLRQPNLAQTLRTIADNGPHDFYDGQIAAAIAADMAAHGGFVTAADLARYEVKPGRHITTPYRGYEIHAIAAPGGGGLVIKALNILENFDLASFTDAQWAAVVSQALAIAFGTMDTDYAESDLDAVVSKDWARDMAAGIVVPERGDTAGKLSSADPVAGRYVKHDWTGEAWGYDSHHTTHIVATDCDGMAVSMTQTVGPVFGSKVITPSLGFVYATTMGTYLSAADESPGSRPRTAISPTIVTRDGTVELVLGGAGGLRIPSGVVQTISRFVDQGRSLADAVAAPRVHPARTNEDSKVPPGPGLRFDAETTPGDGWSADDLKDWQDAGFTVRPNDSVGVFSRVNAAGASDDGWIGVSDPDWEGAAVVPVSSRCAPD